ncbi:MAG TPA: amino acid ABC transporter permease [Anaerolineae bacterium]|nr:amino acid ABC transporter permease [Anaerolineae bacterium]
MLENLHQFLNRILPADRQLHITPQQFVDENITRSWWLTLWLLIFGTIIFTYTRAQLVTMPLLTTIVLILWAVTVLWTAFNEATKKHHRYTLWLKENLYSSINNVFVTLFLILLIFSTVRGFLNYAYFNAANSNDPELRAALIAHNQEIGKSTSDFALDTTAAFTTDPELSRLVGDKTDGARWGAVRANVLNLLLRNMKDHTDRLWASLAIIVVLAVPSFFIYRQEKFRTSWLRTVLTYLWLLSPLAIYALIRGIPETDVQGNGLLALGALIAAYFLSQYISRMEGQTERSLLLILIWGFAVIVAGAMLIFQPLSASVTVEGSGILAPLNPDEAWGGFFLTILISVFAIVVSFPLGVALALGRRSEITGIPAWLTYSLAGAFTIYELTNSTPRNVEAARNSIELVFAYWPLLIPVIAYLFQRIYNGNVVAAFSTLYIEIVRGVPLITVLFTSLILFPIFLPPGVRILNTTRILWAFALFSAAYLAENIRGGLQAIPQGQYEAANALGLSTYHKYRYIIMPQALRLVIPAIVGQFISLFKDTSLVSIVGIWDILNVANGIAAQQNWLNVRTEPYIFLALIYFIGSASMASYSRRLERQLGVGTR